MIIDADFLINNNRLIVVCGTSGIGKTEFAIKESANYANFTGKSTALLLGRYPSPYTQSLINSVSNIDKIHIFEEFYRYSDELSIVNFIEKKLVQYNKIGLVVIDDDTTFSVSEHIMQEYRALMTRYPISIMIMSNVNNKHRKRKYGQININDIKSIYFKMANEIYGISLADSKENNSNVTRKIIRLK